MTTAVDAEASKTAGKVGQDMAAANNEAMLRAAQKIALQLGKEGPLTVDDVTRAMVDQGYGVLPLKNGKRHNWKGKIFPISQWVKIGDMASTIKTSHGRPVAQWVTKEWLRANSLNGRVSKASAYALIRVYKDFERMHKPAIASGATKFEDCNWFIGDEKLCANIRKDIQVDGNKLYGTPVSFVPGAIGALLMPPDPSKYIKTKAAE